MYYPDELIEEVRTRNDIVDVISDYVRLQKREAPISDCVRFIMKNRLRFSVSRQKQMYYCFGCGGRGKCIYVFDGV